ncbi:MAG: hypothetical protein ACI4RP_01335, partial [Acutalibacteraceae bacterium]
GVGICRRMRWRSLCCIYVKHSSIRPSPHQSPDGDSFPPRGSLNSVRNSQNSKLKTLNSKL